MAGQGELWRGHEAERGRLGSLVLPALGPSLSFRVEGTKGWSFEIQ